MGSQLNTKFCIPKKRALFISISLLVILSVCINQYLLQNKNAISSRATAPASPLSRGVGGEGQECVYQMNNTGNKEQFACQEGLICYKTIDFYKKYRVGFGGIFDHNLLKYTSCMKKENILGKELFTCRQDQTCDTGLACRNSYYKSSLINRLDIVDVGLYVLQNDIYDRNILGFNLTSYPLFVESAIKSAQFEKINSNVIEPVAEKATETLQNNLLALNGDQMYDGGICIKKTHSPYDLYEEKYMGILNEPSRGKCRDTTLRRLPLSFSGNYYPYNSSCELIEDQSLYIVSSVQDHVNGFSESPNYLTLVNNNNGSFAKRFADTSEIMKPSVVGRMLSSNDFDPSSVSVCIDNGTFGEFVKQNLKSQGYLIFDEPKLNLQLSRVWEDFSDDRFEQCYVPQADLSPTIPLAKVTECGGGGQPCCAPATSDNTCDDMNADSCYMGSCVDKNYIARGMIDELKKNPVSNNKSIFGIFVNTYDPVQYGLIGRGTKNISFLLGDDGKAKSQLEFDSVTKIGTVIDPASNGKIELGYNIYPHLVNINTQLSGVADQPLNLMLENNASVYFILGSNPATNVKLINMSNNNIPADAYPISAYIDCGDGVHTRVKVPGRYRYLKTNGAFLGAVFYIAGYDHHSGKQLTNACNWEWWKDYTVKLIEVDLDFDFIENKNFGVNRYKSWNDTPMYVFPAINFAKIGPTPIHMGL